MDAMRTRVLLLAVCIAGAGTACDSVPLVVRPENGFTLPDLLEDALDTGVPYDEQLFHHWGSTVTGPVIR